METNLITDRDERIRSFFSSIDRIEKSIDILVDSANLSLGGERYMTDKEVAMLLKVSRHTLWEYRTQGILTYYHIGGKTLYRESDVEKLLQRNCFEAEQ